MSEISDLQIRHAPAANDLNEDGLTKDSAPEYFTQTGDRSKWAVVVVLFLIAATAVGYVTLRRPTTTTPQTAAAPAALAPAAPAERAPLVEAEMIELPPLADTDALVRQLVAKLSSHPKALAWLTTNGLIENFTVATLNLSEGKTPVAHWRTLAPQGRFSVVTTPNAIVLDPASYRRYDEYAAAVGALDATGTARLYLTLKPRIMDAYRGLGHPEGDFDPVLQRAIGALLATPIIEGDIAVRKEILSYEFVDPKVEALPTAAKQLLRTGPDNMRVIQAKLREIAAQLGL